MEKTKIIIKRLPCIIGCAAKCKIEMDGICVGKVANGKTVEFWADKGLHTLSIYWGWKKKTTIEINVDGKDERINLFTKLNIAKDKLDFYSEDNQLLSKDSNKGSKDATSNQKSRTNFARRDVVVLVSAAVVVCLCVVGILLASNSMNDENTNIVNTQNGNMTEEKAVKQNDKVIKLIVKKCDISEEEADQVKKDFESVGINELNGFTEKISKLTVSKWGLEAICSTSNVLDLEKDPMFILTETMEKDYEHTGGHLLKIWLFLFAFVILYGVISIIALKFVDKDKR